jgi:hypothetical protein
MESQPETPSVGPKPGGIEPEQWINHVVDEAINGAWSVLYPDKTVTVPPVLWHYTTSEGLCGILQHASLYATHYEYVNDPSEVQAFTAIAQAVAKRRLATLPAVGQEDTLRTAEEFRSTLWSIVLTFETGNLVGMNSPYVACLSEDGDLLGQWRAYADGCKGYAVGLSTAWLKQRGFGESFAFRLNRVLYEPAEQTKLVEGLLSVLVDKGAEAMATSMPDALEWWTHLLTFMAAEFAPVIKHRAYADEREWRLVLQGKRLDHLARLLGSDRPEARASAQADIASTRVRAANGSLVPYKSVDLEKATALRAVRVGPAHDHQVQKAAAWLLLNKNDWPSSVEVTASSIPVRRRT